MTAITKGVTTPLVRAEAAGGGSGLTNLIANFLDNVDGTNLTPTINGSTLETVGTGSFSRFHNATDAPTITASTKYFLTFEMSTTDGSDIYLYDDLTTTVNRTVIDGAPDTSGSWIAYGIVCDDTQLADDTPVIGYDGNAAHDFRNFGLYELPIT